MPFPRPYRNDPRFVLRRFDRIADHINDVLIVFAFGLAALDLVFAAHRVAEALPPPWLPCTEPVAGKPCK
jgi:hypothetical protein